MHFDCQYNQKDANERRLDKTAKNQKA